jgi:hypothetical protein
MASPFIVGEEIKLTHLHFTKIIKDLRIRRSSAGFADVVATMHGQEQIVTMLESQKIY